MMVYNILNQLKIESELHLYLVGDQNYINELKQIYLINKKIYFYNPVPFCEIVHTANQYDVGLCYFEPVTFNLKHCLPNKM